MSEERERWRPSGRSAGCSGFGLVLVVGLILSVVGAAIGVGCSVRVPGTQANISGAGSVGRKDLARSALPPYLSEAAADRQYFVNLTQSLVLGPAEGVQLFIIGDQPGAPVVDFNISWRNP